VPDTQHSSMSGGVAVVAAPAEIDVTTAEQLRVALLRAAGHLQTVLVADLTGTLFCDSAGLTVLVRAHRRVVAEGGQLRLVLPADGPVARIIALTGLYRLIPCFRSLAEAADPRPAATTWRPSVSAARPASSALSAPVSLN